MTNHLASVQHQASTTLTSPPPRPSRAERKAAHAAANKQLWDSAENPEPFHFVETKRADVPLASEFKPALQLLSRKPKAPAALNDNADEDDDSETEARKAAEKALDERKLKATRERQDKQRKYAEARARLFGPEDPSTVAAGAGAESTAPSARGASSQQANGARTQQPARRSGRASHSAASSSADQSPARQLYNPVDSAHGNGNTGAPGRRVHVNPASPNIAQLPIRLPKGPDGSGRGGIGFAPRGNHAGG